MAGPKDMMTFCAEAGEAAVVTIIAVVWLWFSGWRHWPLPSMLMLIMLLRMIDAIAGPKDMITFCADVRVATIVTFLAMRWLLCSGWWRWSPSSMPMPIWFSG